MRICHLLPWLQQGGNFGDEIGPALTKRMLEHHFNCNAKNVRVKNLAVQGEGNESRKEDETCLLTVGSIYQHARSGDHVWGTGLKNQTEVLYPPNVTHYAVRGNLTVQLLLGKNVVNNPSLPVGDPALALRRFFPELLRHTSDGTHCLIPHRYDMKRVQDKIKELGISKKRLRNISIAQSWISVVKSMRTCATVASSSLHGLVLADVLGIANRWIVFPKGKGKGSMLKEGPYKYQDYFSSIRRHDAAPLTNFQGIFNTSNYWNPPSVAMVDQIASQLEESFPFHLFRKN